MRFSRDPAQLGLSLLQIPCNKLLSLFPLVIYIFSSVLLHLAVHSQLIPARVISHLYVVFLEKNLRQPQFALLAQVAYFYSAGTSRASFIPKNSGNAGHLQHLTQLLEQLQFSSFRFFRFEFITQERHVVSCTTFF